jgi:hypothetical protein
MSYKYSINPITNPNPVPSHLNHVSAFEKVTELDQSLQGKGTNILILNSKFQALQQKLSLWSK